MRDVITLLTLIFSYTVAYMLQNNLLLYTKPTTASQQQSFWKLAFRYTSNTYCHTHDHRCQHRNVVHDPVYMEHTYKYLHRAGSVAAKLQLLRKYGGSGFESGLGHRPYWALPWLSAFSPGNVKKCLKLRQRCFLPHLFQSIIERIESFTLHVWVKEQITTTFFQSVSYSTSSSRSNTRFCTVK